MSHRTFVRWAVPLMLLVPWSLVLGALIMLVGTVFGIVMWPMEAVR